MRRSFSAALGAIVIFTLAIASGPTGLGLRRAAARPDNDGGAPAAKAVASISDQGAAAPAEEGAPEQAAAPAEGDGQRAEQAGGPAAPDQPLSPELEALRDTIRQCLSVYFQHPESALTRSPWGVMHSLIAFGVDTDVFVATRRVNAIGWLCWNGSCAGRQLFYVSNGELRPKNGPGYQGHEGQFLAMLAQSRVKPDYEIRVGEHRFTVADLVEYEKRTCRPRTELTFKLIGLSHYLPSDAEWTSKWGEAWSIPRLIKDELAQPVIGATCGGTHRLMGLAYAVNRRKKRGEPVDGQWARADKYVRDYIEYAFKLQNADGSFSTNWFAGRGALRDPERRLTTTGHILEWLVFALPEERLTEPRVVKSVNYLADLMLSNRRGAWYIGSAGHALHALALYDERVFGSRPGQREWLAGEP